MTDTHALFVLEPTNNPLRTPRLADLCLDLLPNLATDAGLHPVVTPQQRQMVCPLGPITLKAPIPAQLPANGRFVAFQQSGNLCQDILGFLQDVNLVSFLLGKLRVATHLCSSYFGRLEKAAMLPQLALLTTGRVALTN